jgi:tRNA-splicing ligase RtcB
VEAINSRLINWASILDDKTRAQAVTTSQLPFIYPHLALMPDAHLGLGATVGSVIPTLGAIIPAAVGVDIGCGMIAVRTQYAVKDLPRDRKRLREDIERVIPLSAGRNNRRVLATAEPRLAELRKLAAQAGFDPAQYLAKWELQLGSLGSGNHFIEVCADEGNAVWLFLHSGSPGAWPGANASACPPRTWRTLRRARPSSPGTSGNWSGPSTSRYSTARK